MSQQQHTINTCIFIGRLTKDPEIKTCNGASGPFKKATFTLAIDRNMSAQQKQAAQQKGEPTCDFVNFEVTGDSSAEYLQKYYYKGKPMAVTARYKQYSYTDQATGQKKYGHVFEVVSADFCPADNSGNAQDGSSAPQAAPPMNPPNTQPSRPQAPQNSNSGFNMFDDANELF